MPNIGTDKMTVGETITSPSIVPLPQPAPPQIQMAQQTHPPLDPVNAAGVIQNPVQVVQGMQHEASVPNTGGNVIRNNSSAHHPAANHPMAAKVNQEILTSLHFIKDIRRLEKYQRDFFLKVKESLTHVHVLLDHQLMDMAWSDNLAECEENLLKCSTCVQTSSASQLVDAYNVVLHDRERLNNRFQELSVKSSLSEFVVNSRQLLDINAVRVAAEAILKGENPIPAQGDNSVPVDHTFFLGNFCTTSLASSMMASFVPKPVSINLPQGPNKGMVSGSVSEEQILTSTSYPTHPPGQQSVQQTSMYENSPRAINPTDKKLNGNLVPSPSLSGNQQIQGQAQGRPPNTANNVATPSNISNSTGEPVSPDLLPGSGTRGHPSGTGVNPTSDGIQANQTASPHPSSNGIDYNLSGNSIPPATQEFSSSKGGNVSSESGTNTNLPNIYDPEGGLDKFLLTAAAAKDGTAAERAAVVAAAEMAVSNGMYGHELVTAISQITNQGGNPSNRSNNAKSKSPQKPQIDPWGKIANSTEDGNLGPPSTNDVGSTNTNTEGRGYNNRSSNASNRSQNQKANVNPTPTGTGNSNPTTTELNLPNDNTSDSVSTASDEGSRGGQATTPGVGDLSAKPLSFARIASLGLEKQAIHRPNVNNPLAAVAAAQALGAGVGGNFPPNLSTLQMVNAMGGDANAHQASPSVMSAASTALVQPTQIQMAHPTGASIATSLPANVSMAQASINMAGHQGINPVSNSVAGNGPMGQTLHFNNGPSAYPMHHQAQTNAQLQQQQHVGGGGMVSHPGNAGHLQHQQQASPMILSLPPTSNPRYYFDISMEGKRLGRVIIEVQPSIAPKMSQNFSQLVTAEKGFGYKGCHFFQAWRNESVICGDWEHNSGRGGRAAIEGGPLFTPDDTRLPCIRGAVGMRRMSKKHSSLNQVASQFRIILANMNTQFTGIFGHVVSGIEALDKVADMGGDGGRPEKTAMVSNCGVFKS